MMAKMKESRFSKLIPAHLIFIAESASDRRKSDENYAAVCSVMQNFQLLGWDRGLGALWDTDPMFHNEAFLAEVCRQVKDLLACKVFR